MLAFVLDARSGVPAYVQLQQQVKHAMRTGTLRPGDQLPSAREVVLSLGINPNTVLKAYRELERETLIEVRQGQGTFVAVDLMTVSPSELAKLRRDLGRWIAAADALGMDHDDMIELLTAEIGNTQRGRDGMTAAEAARLTDVGVRFRKVWALRHATTVIPTGSVVAVVGTNGAGKSSMIRALVGLQPPTEGSIEVFGTGFRTDDPAHLSRIGYVSQRKPLYGSLRVHEMLRYGAVSNPGWNAAYAQRRIADVGVDPQQRIDRLSGGQRTQVALTMALAKGPELLVLDEPLSDLDPLARREVLNGLMAEVAERGITVVLSSHILGELEHTCDRVVVLDAGRIVLAGEIESLVGEHLLLTGPAEALPQLSRQGDIVDHHQEGASVRVLVRLSTMDSRFLDPRWQRHQTGMDSVVLGHLRAQGLEPEPPTALRITS